MTTPESLSDDSSDPKHMKERFPEGHALLRVRTVDDGTVPLSEDEIEEFIKQLDSNKSGTIEYSEIEQQLDAAHRELAPNPEPHHLHHRDRDVDDRHEFLHRITGPHGDAIPKAQFADIVRGWNVPSLKQDRQAAKDEDNYLKRLPVWRKIRTLWAIRGPEIVFLMVVVAAQLAFGIWQLVKYLTETQYRDAFGWGVVLSKTCAGALYPTMFFLLLSMSRYFATFTRKSASFNRVVNWDRSQSFHIKISIVAICLATLHAIGHLGGSFVFGSRSDNQVNVAKVLGPEAVPRPYSEYVRSLPGWSGLVALGMFYLLSLLSMPAVRKWSYEVFQLGHLLMFPIIGLLAAHGTLGLLQWPMLGYFMAFPAILVIIERSIRLLHGLIRISATLEVLDNDTCCITADIPNFRPWPYKAGQYAFIQVPSISLFQWHPFTISTCVDGKMQVHIKNDGDWTGKLHSMAKKGERIDIKIGIDGPFGAPAQRFYNFEHTIVVGAGIGVTPFSGILADLETRCEKGESVKRDVHFHWLVRERNYLGWFSNLLNRVTKAVPSCPGLEINIRTHVTQKRKSIGTHVFRWLLEQHRTDEHPASPLTGLLNATHFGRPNLEAIMNEHYEGLLREIARKIARKSEKDEEVEREVGVFFCGPPVIGYQLADLCWELTSRGREDGSRIEYFFHMEVFG